MKDLIEEITKLTGEWRSLIVSDHCKDKDFHWYVETIWSYGNDPVYTVQHYGYILHYFEDIVCVSYEEALKTLKKVLIEKIEYEKKFTDENDNETGW